MCVFVVLHVFLLASMFFNQFGCPGRFSRFLPRVSTCFVLFAVFTPFSAQTFQTLVCGSANHSDSDSDVMILQMRVPMKEHVDKLWVFMQMC